jgi:hypothetical protein
MTFYLYVLQNQWIFLALLSGAILTLLMCLTYQSMWHPRGIEQESHKVEIKGVRSFFKWLLSFVPWLIILLVLESIVFTIATVVAKSLSPPNW